MTVPGNIDALLLGGLGGYQIERSLRFNSPDSAYLNRTPASAGNRKTWTWSGWVKQAKPYSNGGNQFAMLFGSSSDASNRAGVQFNSDTFQVFSLSGGSTQLSVASTAVLRDPSAWYHFVVSIDSTQAASSDRAKLYINGSLVTALSSTTYPTQNTDLYLNSTNLHGVGGGISSSSYFDGYLTEVNFIDGQALTPSSFGETNPVTGVWGPKRYAGTYGTNGFYLKFADNRLGVDLTNTATITAPFGGTAENARVTDSVYLISNTTTGSVFTLVQEDFGSVKQLSRYSIGAMYFTGGSSTFELQYSTDGSSWTAAASLSITASGQNFSGNINVNARYVRLQATAFGVNGQGALDSLIIYQDSLGVDSSPNSNNWNVNNFSVTAGVGNDSMIDVPTPYADGGNGRGNYCTLNPLKSNSTTCTFSEGNLKATFPSGGAGGVAMGSIAVSSGKWYWEITVGGTDGSTQPKLGVLSPSVLTETASSTDVSTLGYAYSRNGTKWIVGSNTSYGSAFTTNDVIGFTLDMDAGTLVCYLNNTSQGTLASGLTGFLAPAMTGYNPGTAITLNANFGQRAFAYTPPTGFLALNTQNLPEPSIKKPSSYMDMVLYTGNGSARSITGLGFSPDFVWLKRRSTAAVHGLWDSVRGASKYLVSNNTDAEQTDTTNGVQGFQANGFDLGATATWNGNTETYVAWCWDESATPGFDIVTYTGNGSNRTIAHSLGVAPSMVIVKNRSAATDWAVWSKPVSDSLGAAYCLFLQSTSNAGAYPGVFNSTAPTSSVFSVGTSTATNTNGDTYVAYLWSEVAGFSKFGSYTGNGSADGPFVHCGFRPRWVMIKRTDSTANWQIYDTARDTTNRMFLELVPNSSAEENSVSLNIGVAIDALSNGFKLRDSDTAGNASGGTYIFAAFAESPFKYSLAR